MAAAAASSSGGGSGRKRRRSSVPPRRDGPAPAAAAAAAAARPACVAAAVDAVEAVKQRRAERAAKRRRKDRDRTAKLKRQKQALRDHRDMVKVVIGAAAEGYSRGAVRAALHAAADEYGVQLPLQQQAVAAGAAAAAADVASSDSDADASDAVDAESDAAADEDEAEGTEAEAEACALRARVRELSPFARSKSWTTDMKRLLVLAAVHHVYARQQLARKTGRGLKPAAGAATAAAQFFGANRSRVSAVLKEYAPSGISLTAPHYEFPESDTARAARTDVVELTESQIQAVRDMLKKRAADGATTSYGLIHSHLKETTGLHCSHRVMRERLCELGFGVIGVRSGPVVDLQSDYWCRQRERYIMEYAAAREAELKGDSVIVFVDQSFVNLRHRRTQTVADLNDASYVARPHRSGPKAVLRTGIGKGQLLIISHAITRDGLLARLSPDGQMDRPQFAYDPTAVSAELIYSSGKENEDYHSHFDNFTFLNWVQKQLFPAFNAKYPGKRMVLVLDNSGNQSAVRSDYVKPAASKQELHDVLVANGVTELTVQRRLDNGKSSRRALTSSFVMLPRVLPSDMWMHRAPDGASAEELTAAVRDLYKQKPHLTWSQLEVIVNAGGPAPPPGTADQRKSNFHRVIWTVAYHSESNPIEKQWAVAKNFVAAQHTGNRTMAALRQELLAGLYGDEKDHAGVTAESCAAAADHCERELTEWMHQSQRIRALFPGRGSSAMTIASLNARRRQQYGPLVRPHRRGSRRNEADDAAEQDGCGEDDGSDDLALPPPAAAAAPAPAAASASSAAR